MHPIEIDDVRVVLNPDGGHLDEVVFRVGGQELRPMHRAPWRGSGEVLADDTPTVLRSLAGDFFCAAFCDNDLDGGPPHGWTANGRWHTAGKQRLAAGGVSAAFDLEPKVAGASVRKEIVLRPGQPVVYQRHTLRGGTGRLPIAHHAMIRAPGGVALSFSAKAFGITPPTPLEPDPVRGRSILAYPQRFERLDTVRLADDGMANLTHYPFASGHEDLVLLAEATGTGLGWSAGLAARDGFLFFAIKNARMLPHTILWMSNGGRTYPPWSGRHRAVIGIEEACSFCHLGHRASLANNPLTEAGYPTTVSLSPDATLEVRYAFGAIPAPHGWGRVTAIEPVHNGLRISSAAGSLDVPFDTAFFEA